MLSLTQPQVKPQRFNCERLDSHNSVTKCQGSAQYSWRILCLRRCNMLRS
jgi:hypothetical protein